MVRSDPPKSVRIRTDDGNEHRFDAIEKASEFYGVNKSDAVAAACDDVTRLADAIEDVLGRDDLSKRQRREIADRFDRATSTSIEINVSLDVRVGSDSD